jgi:hypothetical protein
MIQNVTVPRWLVKMRILWKSTDRCWGGGSRQTDKKVSLLFWFRKENREKSVKYSFNNWSDYGDIYPVSYVVRGQNAIFWNAYILMAYLFLRNCTATESHYCFISATVTGHSGRVKLLAEKQKFCEQRNEIYSAVRLRRFGKNLNVINLYYAWISVCCV